MYVIILGAGKTGFSLAQKLIHEGRQVVLIEENRQLADYADENLDCRVLNEHGNNTEVLRKAGIQNADYFIAVTGSDEINMITCAMVAAEFKKTVTVARVRNIDYSNSQMMGSRSFLGINYVINPEFEAARRIIHAIDNGAKSEIMTFDKAPFQIRDLKVGPSSIFNGKHLFELREHIKAHFLVASIQRGEKTMIPSGNVLIHENDVLYVLSTVEGFDSIFEQEGFPTKRINRILMLGGGKTAGYVADALCPSSQTDGTLNLWKKLSGFQNSRKPSLHIVEPDEQRCRYLSERYPKALITQADVSDEGFLEEENLSDYDLMICLTPNQELNLIAAIYGRSKGIGRTISVVAKNGYRAIGRSLDLDITISRKSAVVSSILKIVRQGDVKNLHALSESDLEVLEITIGKKSDIDGMRIKEMKLPKNVLILFVSRGSDSFIPKGEDKILAEDRLVVIAEHDSILEIEKFMTDEA